MIKLIKKENEIDISLPFFAQEKYLETKKTNIRIKSIVNIRKYTKYELITTDFK